MATATKSMAQPHNRKYGNLAQECFTDGMVDHEMHLKMSKKIAQLTKVMLYYELMKNHVFRIIFLLLSLLPHLFAFEVAYF